MNRIRLILAGLSLAVALSGTLAHAQQGSERIVVNVPFDFAVGSTLFPTGQYQFVRTGPHNFLIRNADGHSRVAGAAALIQAEPLSDVSHLKFSIVDGRHVLVEIWNGTSAMGNEFTVSRRFLGNVQASNQ